MAPNPQNNQQRSISDVFPGVTLPAHMADLNLNQSFKKDETSLRQSLIRQLSLGRSSISWPTWSIIGNSSDRPSIIFTVRIEPGVLAYTKLGPPTAEDVFKEAAAHIHNTRSAIENDDKCIDVTDDELINQMSMVVFGSNMIERAGSNLPETIQLCRKIFLGERLSDTSLRSPEYTRRLDAYIQSNIQSQQKILERREVINHAMAFMHMIEAVIREDKPFSEDLVKQIHKILCSGIPVVTGENETIQSNVYASKYRTRHVAASRTNFVTPNKIGQVMTRFIGELNNHLLEAEKNREIDPFFIAAHACGEFVNIHPFIDGNGRVCRIILNVILLKYAGIVCPIGEHDSERREYIEIAKRRSDEESGNGELAWYILKQSMPTLRRLQDNISSRK